MSPDRDTGNRSIEAERGVVAGGDQHEADAGVRMMQEGGDTIDALVATPFVGFVVEPDSLRPVFCTR